MAVSKYLEPKTVTIWWSYIVKRSMKTEKTACAVSAKSYCCIRWIESVIVRIRAESRYVLPVLFIVFDRIIGLKSRK